MDEWDSGGIIGWIDDGMDVINGLMIGQMLADGFIGGSWDY